MAMVHKKQTDESKNSPSDKDGSRASEQHLHLICGSQKHVPTTVRAAAMRSNPNPVFLSRLLYHRRYMGNSFVLDVSTRF